MARESRWPSWWWFWSVPILANLYVLLCCAAFWALRSGVFTAVFTGRLRSVLNRAVRVFLLPAVLFTRGLLQYLMEEVLNVHLGRMGTAVELAVGIGIGELCAVVGGLLLYGAVALVYAIVPARNGGQGERADGA